MSVSASRKPGELLFSLLMVVASVILFWQSYEIAQFSSLSSPGAIPLATSGIMIVTSCIVFARTLKLKHGSEMMFFDHVLPPIVGIVMAVILIYASLLESLGFLLASAAFLFVAFTLLYRAKPGTSLLLTLLVLTVIYVIFRLVFQVILPEGIVPERDILAAIERFFTSPAAE